MKADFKELLAQLRDHYAGEYEKAGKDLEEQIIERAEEFKIAGYEPSLETVIELIVLDRTMPANLKDYARIILDPPTRRRGKGKKDTG